MINSDTIAIYISNIAGLCRLTKFPGTLASIASLAASFLSYYFLGKAIYIFLFFIFLILGFWSINKVHRKSGRGDFQWIGIDEWIGMWLANFFLFEFDFTLTQAVVFSLMSFFVFRIIDIVKFIPPLQFINKDKNQKALPVLLDDIIAGCYAYLIVLMILNLFGFSDMYNLRYLYSSILILLPAMIANLVPPLLKMRYWNNPIHERLFGKNKTWRGFLGAIVFGTLTYLILVKYDLIAPAGNLSFAIFIGFLFSFGAIGGDLLKSFFKRKIGIRAGESWAPWDQIDYILGMMILTYPFYRYSFSQIIFLLALGGAISALVHRFGYIIKINSAKQ